MNKIQLPEKRYRDSSKKDKSLFRRDTKKHKKHKKQFKRIREKVKILKKYNQQLQKTKRTTKLQKKQLYEVNKKKTLIRKQNESNREIKQIEREEKREKIVKWIDIGRFYELALTNKRYVNGCNLHEIKSENLEDYTVVFELIGSIVNGDIEQKTNIRFKNVDDFETYIIAIDIGGYDSEDVFPTG